MPGFGLERERDLDLQGVYRIPPGGGDPQLVVGGRLRAAERSLLLAGRVAALRQRHAGAYIRVFDVGSDGTLSNGRMFFDGVGTGVIEEGIPDGMKCDEHGNIWVTGPGGVWVIRSAASTSGRSRSRRTSAT